MADAETWEWKYSLSYGQSVKVAVSGVVSGIVSDFYTSLATYLAGAFPILSGRRGLILFCGVQDGNRALKRGRRRVCEPNDIQSRVIAYIERDWKRATFN